MDALSEESQYLAANASAPFLWLLLLSLASQKNAPHTTENILNEYDYIVVGSGTAGSAVAARLSEKPCVKVLLLEAGKLPPKLTEVPLLAATFYGSDIDWSYTSTPQKYSGFGLNNRQMFIPSGKVVGGNSVLGGMLYVRGHRDTYDKWNAGGATGWGYDDVLPYFKKAEQDRNPNLIEIPYHGFRGPITVEKPQCNSSYKSAVEHAITEFNYSRIDVNGRNQKGFYDYQMMTRNGQRCSGAKGYLVPAGKRANLDIVKNAFVTKVLIKHRKAIGVQYEISGKLHTVRAKREVILSTGNIRTPQLLMLSGIGPKEHLKQMGIPLVADLPAVGKNFQDHFGSYVMFYSDALQPITEQTRDPSNILTYIFRKSGLWTTNLGLRYTAFLTNAQNTPPEAIPDYQIYFLGTDTRGISAALNINQTVYKNLLERYENKSNIWCASSILQPRSRGFVKLRSTNPHDSPVINLNYFEDPDDIKDVVAGMKECYRIFSTKGFKELGVKPYETLVPGCEQFANDQELYFRCLAKFVTAPYYHSVGTAKMGDPDDPTTVVDTKLKVKGVRRLRVVDASVMPIIPRANTVAAVRMVAEKAADIIKKKIHC